MKVELKDPLFISAIPILRQIESHGYEAYFVGGCVRDTLLNKPIHDIDIATSATPEEIEAIFPITFDVGKEHGTIIVLDKQIPYEITTFRIEGKYSDYRHPDSVDFVRDLKEDTLRRDFTINALAFDAEGQLYDYHHGQKDLENEIIRAVGIPIERFEEDALRTVRAIRFSSQLGFQIEANTLKAIQEANHLLKNIATERIRIELSKFFQGKYFTKFSHILVSTGIADCLSLLKNLNVTAAMSFMQISLEGYENVDERLAWYLFGKGLDLKGPQFVKFLRQWTHSNHLIESVKIMEKLDDIVRDEQLTEWEIYSYDAEIIDILEHYHNRNRTTKKYFAQKIREKLPIHSKQELVVNGKVIMDWLNLEKGNAQLGQLINKIEYLVVMGQMLNTEEALKKFVLENY